jgi:hypothetical protein
MTVGSGKGSINVKNKDLPSCNTSSSFSSLMALQSHVDLCLLNGLLPIRSVYVTHFQSLILHLLCQEKGQRA